MHKPSVFAVLFILCVLCTMFKPLTATVKASEEPYFHRYSDIKELYVGGIPESNSQNYMSQIMTASYNSYGSSLSAQKDQLNNPISIEKSDIKYNVVSRYESNGQKYYGFKLTFSGQFTGSFYGSPIDPWVLAAVVFVIKMLIIAVTTAVVIVIAVGIFAQWLTDITTRNYEKITYDENGNILSVEHGVEPTVNVTHWILIAAITAAAVILIPKVLEMRKQKSYKK